LIYFQITGKSFSTFQLLYPFFAFLSNCFSTYMAKEYITEKGENISCCCCAIAAEKLVTAVGGGDVGRREG
jgi:hypothetical protein